MNSYIQTLRNLGAARLGIMALVTLGVVGFFVYLSTRLSSGDMSLLYSDLARTDSGAIVKKLDALHVPYQVNPEGTNIMVPSDQVGKIRMELATDGLPAGGSIGYEIFDQQPAFGTTSFMQNMNQLRALEGELSRTVGTLAPVRQARIHLVMPRRELFSRDENPASASVLLQLRPGAQLSREQVNAIRNLVAAAVPQLKADAISIVDDHGNLLARPSEGDTEADLAQSMEERRRAFEARLSRTVEDLVGRTVGAGKVRATVTADMDFDRVTTNTDTYDPDGQVVRSTQTVQETNNSEDSAEKNSAVTVNNNIPGGQAQSGAGGNSSKVQGNRQEETVNYEISHKTENHVREAGQVKRLSVAVIVDGTYAAGADGKEVYHPRTDQEIQQITQLVKSAVGFEANRGDSVDVSNMQFVQESSELGTVSPETSLLGFSKHDIMHLAEVALIAIVAVLILLLIVRPLMTRLLASAQLEPQPDGQQPLLAGPRQGVPQLAGPTGSALAQALSDTESEENDSMIDITQVEGRVRASSIRKIGEIVEKHPTEAVSILRGWIYQES
ncbi:MAG TPA: flagellar basal-body MS-ring/collar protein FliF [Alphaproteobacteria bacterium]|nr:flagellar basal-body MS-ring/collar protein FliF [Alphaproteobacteria bacterium]